MPVVRQCTFSGGETARELANRTDLARYGNSLRRCRNFFITPQGAAMNRAGFPFIAYAKNEAHKVRIKEFCYSDDLNYFLELGHRYIRVRSMSATGTVVADFVTPYTETDLPKVKFAQLGATMTIYCKAYTPYDLKIVKSGGTYSFTFAPTVLVVPQTGPVWVWIDNWDVAWESASSTQTPRYWQYAVTATYVDGTETLLAMTDAYLFDRVKVIPQLKWTWNVGNAPLYFTIYIGRDNKFWYLDDVELSSSRVGSNSVGDIYKYVDSTTASDLATDAVLGDFPHPGWSIESLQAAMRRAGSVTNVPNAPNTSIGPPSFSKPYYDVPTTWLQNTWYNVGDRILVNGTTYEAISAGRSSHTGLYIPANASLVEDGDPLRVKNTVYAAGAYVRSNGVAWLCTLGGTTSAHPGIDGAIDSSLMVVDGTANWRYQGSAGRLMWKYVQVGATEAEYPAVGTFFQQRRIMANFPSTQARPIGPAEIVGSRINQLSSFDTQPGVLASDAVSRPLFSNNFEEIRSLVPVWGLLAFTNKSPWIVTGSQGYQDPITPQSFSAVAQTSFGASWLDPVKLKESIVFVQELGKTVIELMLSIGTEFMKSSDLSVWASHLFEKHSIVSWTYAAVPYGILWMVREDGKLLGLTHHREHEVFAWHWHDTDGVFEDVCAVPDGSEYKLIAVVKRTINGVARRHIEMMASRTLSRTDADADGVDESVTMSEGVFLDAAKSYGPGKSSVITDLSHLEGETVGVLADGAYVGEYVVVSGSIDISENFVGPCAESIHVGLPYRSELETLDLASHDVELKGRETIIDELVLEVIDSFGFKVGTSYDKLKEARLRKVSEDTGAPEAFSGTYVAKIPDTYKLDGRAVVVQDKPMPVTVLGIGRNTDVSDG